MSARRSYGAGSLDRRADRGGDWYGRWRKGGRLVQRRIGPANLTKREAEEKLREIMGEVKARRKPGETLSVGDVGERYRQDLADAGRKRTTIIAAELALRVHLEPYFKGRSVDAITTKEVQELVSKLRGDGLAAKSIRNYIGTLSALYNWAKAQDPALASHNPCEKVKLPAKRDAQEIRFLELHEVDALIDAVPAGTFHDVDRAIILTAAMTGLREAELIALRWRDVDWKASRIRVRQNYVRGEYGTPKSRRSSRSVPMADRVAGELHKLSGGHESPDALVFANPLSGGPQERAALYRRYKVALKAAKLDESRRFHDLRHTFGTRMAAARVPMRTLQEWMGHRDIQTTMIYADYAPSATETAMVNDAFGPGPASGPGSHSGHIPSESDATQENER